jgi:hypothetical protein
MPDLIKNEYCRCAISTSCLTRRPNKQLEESEGSDLPGQGMQDCTTAVKPCYCLHILAVSSGPGINLAVMRHQEPLIIMVKSFLYVYLSSCWAYFVMLIRFVAFTTDSQSEHTDLQPCSINTLHTLQLLRTTSAEGLDPTDWRAIGIINIGR